jgi:hypothetical protein
VPDELSENPVEPIEFDKLRLDPKNPRLLDLAENPSKTEIVEALLDQHDPINIARALVEFGYFNSEALIAITEDDGETFIVIEGNRRLVAMMLLKDEKLRQEAGADPEWSELAARLDEKRPDELKAIPCQVVSDRRAAAPNIGYRHIVGIKKWDAHEKAAFVTDLLKQVESDEPFQAVSNLTGETPHRVRTYVRDFRLLEQAEREGLDVSRAEDKFGRFTRAMNAAGVSRFVGAKPPSEIEPDEPNAYEADGEQMKKLLSYVFGEEGGPPPVFSDTRQVRELGVALASEDGRRILDESRELESAYEAAGGLRERLLNNLAKALTALQAAGDDLPAHRNDDEVLAAIAAVAQAVEALSHGDPVPASDASPPHDDEEASTLDDDWDEEDEDNDE